MEHLVLNVDGMTCGGCVRGVEKALSRIDGVATAKADLAAKRAVIDFDPTHTSATALIAAIESLGYQATNA